MAVIPRDNIPDKKDTVVCKRNWPVGYFLSKDYGKERPRDPPSVFTCVKPSLIPSPSGCLRSHAKSRNIQPDELSAFNLKEVIQLFNDLKTNKGSYNLMELIYYLTAKQTIKY